MDHFPTLLLLLLWTGSSCGQPILRYTTNSCSSLEPQYTQENYASLNLGPDHLGQHSGGHDDSNFFGAPKKLSNRQPPFELETDFVEYRRNKKYIVRLVAFATFDSFMLQARGQLLPDGNASYVGEFVQVPSVANWLQCGNYTKASVIDKGRPIELGNITFTWRAPGYDAGPVRLIASVVYNDAYVIINSRSVGFASTPVNVQDTLKVAINNCGTSQSCFRSCESDPNCPAEETDYILTIGPEQDGNIVFKLGGYLLPSAENYIGVGFGYDYYLMNTDIVACFREGNTVRLRHFLLEDSAGQPFLHRQNINIEDGGVNQINGFSWCQFVRPISPLSVYDLDFRRSIYHFYLWGNMTQDLRIVLPPLASIQRSYSRVNISYIYNDVRFTGSADRLGIGRTIFVSAFIYCLFTLFH